MGLLAPAQVTPDSDGQPGPRTRGQRQPRKATRDPRPLSAWRGGRTDGRTRPRVCPDRCGDSPLRPQTGLDKRLYPQNPPFRQGMISRLAAWRTGPVVLGASLAGGRPAGLAWLAGGWPVSGPVTVAAAGAGAVVVLVALAVGISQATAAPACASVIMPGTSPGPAPPLRPHRLTGTALTGAAAVTVRAGRPDQRRGHPLRAGVRRHGELLLPVPARRAALRGPAAVRVRRLGRVRQLISR